MQQEYADLFQRVLTEKQREIAERFDAIHSVQRALQVGSLDAIVEPSIMRAALIDAIEEGLGREEEVKAPVLVQVGRGGRGLLSESWRSCGGPAPS